MMMKYTVNVSLEKWALIHYAHHVWKQPNWKQHLLELVSKRDSTFQHVIPLELHKELEKIKIPPSCRKELKLVIGTMGNVIKNYFVHLGEIRDDLTDELKLSFIDHFHWNYLGYIDESQTIKSLYESGLMPTSYLTWHLLCNSCVEECIIDFWRKISDNKAYSQFKEEIGAGWLSQFDFLMDYWRLRMQNNLEKFQLDRRDSMELNIDQLMFCNMRMRFNNGSALYFWNRLDDASKKSTMVYLTNHIDHFKYRNISRDLIMFNIRVYNYYGLEDALLKMMKSPEVIAEMLVWPCEDNFIPLMEQYCRLQDNRVWESIASGLVNLILMEHAFTGDASRSIKWFDYLWYGENTADFKREFLRDHVWMICRHDNICLLKHLFILQPWVDQIALLDAIINFMSSNLTTVEFLRKFNNEVLPKNCQLITDSFHTQFTFRDEDNTNHIFNRL